MPSAARSALRLHCSALTGRAARQLLIIASDRPATRDTAPAALPREPACCMMCSNASQWHVKFRLENLVDSIKKTHVPLCGEGGNSIPASLAEEDASERVVESVGTGKTVSRSATCVYKGPGLLFSGKLYTHSHILSATRGRLTSYLTSAERWKK